MKDLDKERIINRYNDRLCKHGANISALASGTEERRDIRFRVMTEVGIVDRDSVLDLGCGFGDYLNYLSKQDVEISYTGYDINPKLIEIAQERFPGRCFEVKDILQEDFPIFDYIVSTSCFNLPLQYQDNYEFVEQILRTCYDHTRKGVSIDFLSSYVDFKSDEGFHYEPERIFQIAKSITKCVELRHDYPLFEFNIYLYKDFSGWSKQKT